MSSTARRFGTKDSATRAALIQAGIEVLQSDGAAAFSARRVAEHAGLKPQLVHYYFRTIEDLVVAMCQVAGSENLKRAARAAASEQPLRELWEVSIDDPSAGLVAELKALALHSEPIRSETVRLMEQQRVLTTEALRKHLERRGSPAAGIAMSIVMISDALSRLLVSERALGFTLGHDQMKIAMQEWMDNYYGAEDAVAQANSRRPATPEDPASTA